MTTKETAFAWLDEITECALANGWELADNRDNPGVLCNRIAGFVTVDKVAGPQWLTVIVTYDHDGQRARRAAFRTDWRGNSTIRLRDIRRVLKSKL